MAYTDTTIITWGKYKGRALANIPADYLLYVYTKGWGNTDFKEYLADNLEIIRAEAIKLKNYNSNKKDEA